MWTYVFISLGSIPRSGMSGSMLTQHGNTTKLVFPGKNKEMSKPGDCQKGFHSLQFSVLLWKYQVDWVRSGGNIQRVTNVKPIPKPELLLPTHRAWLRPALRALFWGQANRKDKTEVAARLVTSLSQTFCVWLSHVSAVLLLT